jgi:perosamine synthetase
MSIPLARPDISQADIDAVVGVLRTPHLSLGPKLREFEEAFCDYTGAHFATAVNSGTSALHLAVKALGIGPGHEVVTSPFSFVASANCMLFEGAKPVFVDIDPLTFNLDVDAIEDRITEATRAILPVHVFGRPADMDTIGTIADKHQLHVIEDACEALGSRWKGRQVGRFGKAGVFAFYPNKQITTGEGGMLVTDDPEIDRLSKSLRNQGRDDGSPWLQHERLGYNYRICDINCALGVSQLARIDSFIAKRRKVADFYRLHLEDIEDIRLPLYQMPDGEISWFVYVIQLRYAARLNRDELMDFLRSKGVACSNYFAPIHLQPYFRRLGYRPGDFPLAERIGSSTIALPFFNQLEEESIRYVARKLREGIQEQKRRARSLHQAAGPALQPL